MRSESELYDKNSEHEICSLMEDKNNIGREVIPQEKT